MDPLDHVLTALIAADSAAVTNLPVVLGALDGVSLGPSAHLRKLVARLSTLMHSKEPSARWAGICIANHCFNQDRDAVLEHAHVWVATCLPVLSRNEPPSLWRAAIALLDSIFVLTANLTEFQRQIVNPNAAKFASALVALVDKADTDTQVFSLNILARLFCTYPTLVRGLQASVLPLCLKILRGRYPSPQPAALISAAARLAAVRHLAGGKVGGSTAWKEAMDAALANAHSHLDELRSTFADGKFRGSAFAGQQGADPVVSIPTALDGLRCMVALIRQLLVSPSERPLPVPIGGIAALCLRLLQATADEPLENSFDKSKRAIQASVAPRLRQLGSQLLCQAAESIRTYLSGDVPALLQALVARLEQPNSFSDAHMLQALLSLSRHCIMTDDTHLLSRAIRCLLPHVSRVVANKPVKPEGKQEPATEKRGKKRGAYEGEELFGVGGAVVFTSVEEGDTVLLVVDCLQQLLCNPAAPADLESLAARVFISVTLQLPVVAPSALSIDESLHPRLLARILSASQDIAAGRATMSQSVGLVARLSGETASSREADTQLDLLLRPRLPPFARSRAVLDTSLVGPLQVLSDDEPLNPAIDPALDRMAVDQDDLPQFQDRTVTSAVRMLPPPATAALPPAPVSPFVTPTLAAPKPSVMIQASELENGLKQSQPLLQSSFGSWTAASEVVKGPVLPALKQTAAVPPPTAVVTRVDGEDDEEEMPAIDVGSDSDSGEE